MNTRSGASGVLAAAVAAVSLFIMAVAARGTGADTLVWLTWASAVPFLVLLSPGAQDAVRALVQRSPWTRLAVPGVLVAVGVAAARVSGTVPLERMAAWSLAVGVTVALVLTQEEDEARAWRLIALALALGAVAGLWDRSLKVQVPGGTGVGFAYLTAAGLALFLLRSVKPLASLDVRLGLSADDARMAATAVLALMLVAIPAGMLADYVTWNPRPGSVPASAERWLGLTVFIAIPEELLFRGLIQEGLSRLRGRRFGLWSASVLFGLVHIGKSTGLTAAQVNVWGLNWRYAVLATLAGLAYGWVYQRTGKVSAAAVTHGTVNWLWSSFLLR